MAGTLVDSIAQYVAQRILGEGIDIIALGVSLGAPFLVRFEMVGNGSVLDRGIEFSPSQFVEEAGDATRLPGKVVDGKLLCLKLIKETFSNLLHVL